MKRCCVLFTIFAMALFAGAGCERLQNPTAPESNNAIQKSQIKPHDYNAAEVKAKLDAIAAKARAWVAQHQAQQASKRASNPMAAAAGSKVITVPKDYPTIQQAVDAAAPGDKIKVKSGTYNEFITVAVQDVEITAQGAVTVNGGFIVAANQVTIGHFTINPLFNPGIGGAAGIAVFGSFGAEISGVEIKDNITSGGDAGVVLQSSTNCIVKDNHISGTSPTFIGGGIVLSDADGNTIDSNRATGNNAGIGLQPDCDNNIITRNTCDANIGLGIALGGTSNKLSNNSCNACFVGILVYTASNNTIGLNNTANQNGNVGLLLNSDAVNNTVENNTFLENVVFDILNNGIGNTFFKNKAVNTSGV